MAKKSYFKKLIVVHYLATPFDPRYKMVHSFVNFGGIFDRSELHQTIPDICNFFYTGRILKSQILHQKND